MDSTNEPFGRGSPMNVAAAVASTTITPRTTQLSAQLSPQIIYTQQQQKQCQQVHGLDEPINKLSVPIQLIKNFMKVFTDIGIKHDRKLKCILEINEQLECLVVEDENIYKLFLEYLMPIFLQILEDGKHHYLMENPIQQIRKHILDIINRLPPTELLNPYITRLLTITYRLIQTDNEENGLICLRIIMVLLKQYRPEFQSDVIDMLTFIQTIYKNIAEQFPITYKPNLVPIHRVHELTDSDINLLLLETFTITQLYIDKDGREKTTYNLIPKTCLSLKLLQEVTISILSLYQFYKQNEYLVQVISNFIPLILNVILIEIGPLHKNASTVSKELYIEFIATQVKTISFLTYLSRIYKNELVGHEANIAKGLLNLLQHCPKESANLRRELLVITRHNLLTDVKYAFVQSIDMIFDEELLIGRGYTAYEALRPLACATLADFVHYVRPRLGMNTIRKAVYLFSKYLHDATLPISVQAMCCTIIMNLIDGVITHSEYGTHTARDLAITMLKIITLKFRTIAKLQLTTTNIPQNSKLKKSDVNTATAGHQQLSQKGDRIENNGSGGGGGAASASNDPNAIDLIAKYNVNNKLAKVNIIEYRGFVKKLVYGVKAITWGIINCKSPLTDPSNSNRSLFNASEILIFIDLIHYALEVFEIFSLNLSSTTTGTTTTTTSGVLMKEEKALIKEEKEIIEQFMGIFTQMSGQHFQEIFSNTIDFIIERIHQNKSLNLLITYFLDNELMPPILITMLIEYLLKNMDKIGSKMERSHLHLNLFKSIFCSVANYSTENEHTLRPHLHKIVNQSMELAMTSNEPYNYFLLLRAMFRAICDGRHELLYQEFLPLLPIVLEKLNRIQSNCHRQYMKDILLELCLTLPVRVSSLLPYLPMLMDVIIPSINSPNDIIITKGLQSLGLCVETLQTDFLHEHIQPVRGEIIQLLWQKLRCDDSIAQKAFRLFAKMGNVNRKILHEPQKLTYANGFDSNVRPSIGIRFEKSPRVDNAFNIVHLPIDKIILMSLKALRANAIIDVYYKKQSWDILRCYLATVITFDDDINVIKQLYLHESFTNGPISEIPILKGDYQKLVNYRTHVNALTGMFMAVTVKELTDSVLPIMTCLLRHYTMVSIAQTAGPFRLAGLVDVTNFKIQPTVLIDAIAIAMAHEDKELCRPGYIAMRLILNIAIVIMGDRERASRLPIMQYLGECMIELCYEHSWYAKKGGCIALKFLYQNMSDRWIYRNLLDFLKAYQFIISDLTDEIGCGTIDLARQYLEKMLEMFMGRLSNDLPDRADMGNANNEQLLLLLMIQKKAQYDVVHELVRQIVNPNPLIREQSMAALHLIADLQMKNVYEIMESHRDLLNELIPPKKYLLRHQPAATQMAIMDSNTFCTTLKPRLFSLDINDNHHKQFFHELVTISELDDNLLNKIECYKNITNLIPLRKSALRALSTMHYITDAICRDKIICTLLKSLEKPNAELQEVAFECLQQFISMASSSSSSSSPMGENQYVQNVLSALKIELEKGDLYNLSIHILRRVHYLAKLFPSTILEGASSDHLIIALKKCLEKSIQSNRNKNFFTTFKNSDLERKLLIIFDLLREMSNITIKFIEVLCNLVMHTELCIMIESHSPFREPLVRFLVNYPKGILEILLKDDYVKVARWNRFTLYLLKHHDAKAIRDAIQQCEINRLMTLILGNPFSNAPSVPQSSTTLIAFEDRYEAQYLAVSIMELLMEIDETWIHSQLELIIALKTIWKNDLFKTCDIYPTCDLWHKVGKILLKYFSYNVDEIELLFMLMNAFKYDFIPDFQFLRDFLQNNIAQTYTIEWKRNAFFKFINYYLNPEVSEDLKAKIITSILMPCFAVCFECGNGDELIGTTPLPHEEDDNNIVSVYITKVINPDTPFSNDDFLRVAIFQMACLFVECASKHIHDGRKLQGNRLRRLMTYSWPCLLAKNYVDAAARYHGLLLMSHIITRFAINERIVLQVFHSLLRGYGVEARSVVRASLEILTPIVPLRVEDGNKMLIHWTKKIIVEEGHILQHLYHVLLVVVHHSKVYYPVRHQLIPHMVQSIKRLGFSQSSSLDYRKLSIELCETIVKWEVQRARNEQYKLLNKDNLKSENVISNQQTIPNDSIDESSTTTNITRSNSNSGNTSSSIMPGGIYSLEFNNQSQSQSQSQQQQQQQPQQQQQHQQQMNDENCCIPIDINAYNIILNHLIKLACQVNNDSNNVNTAAANSGSGQQQQQQQTGQQTQQSSSSINALSHENLSQRCYLVIELAMKSQGICKSELYDLKLSWMDSLIIINNNNNNNNEQSIKSSTTTNCGNICTAIELLTFFITILNENQLIKIHTDVQIFLIQCAKSVNIRIIRCMYNFLTTAMGTFPIVNAIIKTTTTTNGATNSSSSIHILYETVVKVIANGIEERAQQQLQRPVSETTQTSLYGVLMMMKAICNNYPQFIDRFFIQFMRLVSHLFREYLKPQSIAQDLAGRLNNSTNETGSSTNSNTVLGGSSNPIPNPNPNSNDVQSQSMVLELLILSIDLIKPRINAMPIELRKYLLNGINNLIEDTQDSLMIKSIIKMCDYWMKSDVKQKQRQPDDDDNRDDQLIDGIPNQKQNQRMLTIDELSMLLQKLILHVNRRFPNDYELITGYLNLIHYIYTEPYYSNDSQLTTTMETSFLYGLRFKEHKIRNKFITIYDETIKRCAYTRILYIIGTKSWDSIGQTYWMKQCIELLLLCVDRSTMLLFNGDTINRDLSKLPNILSILIANHHSNNNNNNRLRYEYVSTDKRLIMDYLNNVNVDEDEIDGDGGGGGGNDNSEYGDDVHVQNEKIGNNNDNIYRNDRNNSTNSNDNNNKKNDNSDQNDTGNKNDNDNKMECDDGEGRTTDGDDENNILLDWPVNDNLVVIVNEEIKIENKKIENRNTQLSNMIDKHFKFYDEMNEIHTSEFILATIQLLHMDDNNTNNSSNNYYNNCDDGDPSMNELCESLWIDLFPRLWSTIFTADQRTHLHLELIQFLANGTYQIVQQQQKKNCYTSAIHTFVEAFHHCVEHPIELPTNLMIYLSKSHNLWHRMTLQLEDFCVNYNKQNLEDCCIIEEQGNNNNNNNNINNNNKTDNDININNENNKDDDNEDAWIDEEVEEYDDDDDADEEMIKNSIKRYNVYVEPLSEMYSELGEEDLWSALWLKHSKYSETSDAIAFEQMGFYEEAQQKYELAMHTYKQDINNGLVNANGKGVTGKMMTEIRLWESHWIRCAKILNQWDIILDFAQSLPKEKKCTLIMDGSWRTLNWPLMKSALSVVEQSHMSEGDKYKINLYKGYLAILHEKDITSVDRCVRAATSICIGEWRRLPSIVSNMHVAVLQATQQIMDLDESCQFRQIAQNFPQIHPSSVHDIKATVKKWCNRLPTIADDYSYWNDILTFRQHVYDIFTNFSDGEPDSSSLKMINVHASAQSCIVLAKVARKYNLFSICEEMLSRVLRLPSVPLVDCFQKICQRVKCFLSIASIYDRNALNEALDELQQTNYRIFQPEMTAEFLALKGHLLALTGKSDEANKSFAESVEHCDTSTKAWELWGNYLENIFIKLEPKQLHFAEQSIICFLLACRQQNEIKSRKYLAKVLWLLSYDDASCILMKAFDKYILGVSQLHWVPWIPQLVSCVVQYDSTVIVNLLTQIGRLYPQAVYFPIRTMYITLKYDHRERHKIAEQKQQQQQQKQQQHKLYSTTENSQPTPTITPPPPPSQSESQPIIINPEQIPATPSMWRCSKVMQMQREIHSTVLSPLEGIIDQMACFRENWYEEIYQLLRYTLHKCYTIGFENRETINRLTLTTPIIAIIKKILIIFSNSMENINNYGIQLRELFNMELFKEFQCDFDMGGDDNRIGSYELVEFIALLTKWSNKFEVRIDHLPKSFIMGEKFRYLLNFTRLSADIELPGELLQPNQSHYHKRIAKFMPRVDIIRRNNCSPRCLHIRGTNGKIYPYLIMHETFMDATAASEERVLQLFRTLNYSFGKHKETAKRHLNIHVPKVISVSPQTRIVEYNQSTLTLFDMFKGYCRQNSNLNYDLPINWYFKRLSNLQKNYKNIDYNLVFNEIYQEIQTKYVSKSLLKQWAVKNYPCAVQYWQFRKMFTVQYALACLCEHIFYLTKLRADQLYVHQDSGLLNASYYKFNIDDMSTDDVHKTSDCPTIPLTTGTTTTVPFRLTPNILEFLSPFNISGPYTATVIAAARTLMHNTVQLDAILRTILHNEFIDQLKRKKIKYEKEIERDATGNIIETTIDLSETIPRVYKSVGNIMDKLYNISLYDNIKTNQFTEFISTAMDKNILSKMDPQWHAWL